MDRATCLMSKEKRKRQKKVLREMRERKLKKTWWGKTFYFIWYEDSLLSWIINIILAFIFIKFIFYPLLGILFGTGIPVVAVVSCSMDHGFTNCDNPGVMDNLCGVPGDGPVSFDIYWDHCGSFYTNRGITQDQFKEFPMNNGFKKGEIIFLKGVSMSNIEIGDIVVFNAPQRSYPIIHRVIEKNSQYIGTKGDHNKDQIQDGLFNEKQIKDYQMMGKAFFRLPYLGYIKIWFTDLVTIFR